MAKRKTLGKKRIKKRGKTGKNTYKKTRRKIGKNTRRKTRRITRRMMRGGGNDDAFIEITREDFIKLHKKKMIIKDNKSYRLLFDKNNTCNYLVIDDKKYEFIQWNWIELEKFVNIYYNKTPIDLTEDEKIQPTIYSKITSLPYSAYSAMKRYVNPSRYVNPYKIANVDLQKPTFEIELSKKDFETLKNDRIIQIYNEEKKNSSTLKIDSNNIMINDKIAVDGIRYKIKGINEPIEDEPSEDEPNEDEPIEDEPSEAEQKYLLQITAI